MDGLTERGRALVELLADLSHRRTVPEAAAEVGLSPAYAYRLTRTRPFLAALRTRVRELVGVELVSVYAALLDQAKAGGPAGVGAAKILLQALGEVDTPGVAVQVNTVGAQVTGLPERLQRHLEARRELLARLGGRGNGCKGRDSERTTDA